MAASSQMERSEAGVLRVGAVRDHAFVSPDNPHGHPHHVPDLHSIVSMEELSRRPSRPADHAAENRAIVALMQEMAASPQAILQKLADTALMLCRAHSAGLSLLEDEDQRTRFHWRAIAGRWAAHVGGGTPRDFGPCGTVLDRNEALLFSHPERDFPCMAEASPFVDEGLLVPFAVNGEPIGTIWVVAHDESRRFDAEDLRVMKSLGAFASAAYQTLLSLSAAIAAERRAEQFASASRLLASIVSSSNDAIASKDLDGLILSWNKGAERLFGYTAEEVIGKPVDLLLPDGYADEEVEILERVRRGEHIDSYETVRRRKDGSLIDVALSVSPITDGAGGLIGASSIARDISERRLAREQQRLLLREMNHRVKNLFTVAGGLVALSARSASSPRELAGAVRERFAALTRVHDLTRPGVAGTVEQACEITTLHVLIRTIFAPYADTNTQDQECPVLTGPDVPVGRTCITNAALLFHELTTNAAKYGALAAPRGTVHIDCALEQTDILLTWTERGGPPLAGEPEHEGFGFDFMRRVVEGMLRGRIAQEWNRDGLVVRLSLPVAVLGR